jgi:hypothetical protein
MNPRERVANIGPRQRRRRRVLGVVSLCLGISVALGLWALGWPPPVRLALAPVFLGGFLGVLQAREKT